MNLPTTAASPKKITIDGTDYTLLPLSISELDCFVDKMIELSQATQTKLDRTKLDILNIPQYLWSNFVYSRVLFFFSMLKSNPTIEFKVLDTLTLSDEFISLCYWIYHGRDI
jgi:hypothetical protein